MKQILQNLRNGATELAEVPRPRVQPGHLLIRTSLSMVSAGTERMLVDFGKSGWIEKARSQPDKVRMVLDKIKTDGVAATYVSVTNKLDQPLTMGYCNFGTVVELGEGVSGFYIGQRVASNGKHAEIVNVPVNLCAAVPDSVSAESASFTVLGAIALQGIRLIEPTLGECIAVTGLGLVGLLAVQLLRAQGCRVLGIDTNPARVELARQLGAEAVDLSRGEDPVAAANTFSRGRGVDGVLIAASTQSDEPMHQAALMCRKRGRIVLVGVSGLSLTRADFYEKELSFQVSCSYGPGRYDTNYEDKGYDYPIGFVRWTEQRNLEAVLDMFADRRLDCSKLVTHRLPFYEAEKAYQILTTDPSALGIVLEYPTESVPTHDLLAQSTVRRSEVATRKPGPPVVAFIGAGNYATGVLMPAFKAAGVQLKTVVSNAGVTAFHAGRKFGFQQTGTDIESVMGDPEIDLVAIATRHDSHARLICNALDRGKPVFVEKPLVATREQLIDVQAAVDREEAKGGSPFVMVGFNRRFAPFTRKIREFFSARQEPMSLTLRVNAGFYPRDHWVHRDGGRIVGEFCHFVDWTRAVVGVPIRSVSAAGMLDGARYSGDNLGAILTFADGSLATLLYAANGCKAVPKELFEVFCEGSMARLDDFRGLELFSGGKRKNFKSAQDKGQRRELQATIEALAKGEPSPIPFQELVEVTEATFLAVEAARTGECLFLGDPKSVNIDSKK